MAYTKQNFTKGMTLEHYHLENIEKGILDNIEAIKDLNIASGNVEKSFKGKVIRPNAMPIGVNNTSAIIKTEINTAQFNLWFVNTPILKSE